MKTELKTKIKQGKISGFPYYMGYVVCYHGKKYLWTLYTRLPRIQQIDAVADALDLKREIESVNQPNLI